MSRGMMIVLGVLVSFVLIILSGLGGLLEMMWHLLVGWISFTIRVVPSMRIEPGGVVLGTACLVGVAVLGHWLASWLWRETHPQPTPRWRVRWTVISLGLILLMFVCGLAATGVVHQVTWLIQSEERLFTSPGFRRIRCGSEMRQLGAAIRAYTLENEDRLPDSLAELQAITPYLETACPSDAGLDYVYYGRGLTWPVGENVPILAEPLRNHEGEGMTIFFGDGTARFVDADSAQAILANRPRSATSSTQSTQ